MAASSQISPPPDPLVPADFGGWVEKVVGIVRRSFAQLLMIQIGLTVVSAVGVAILDDIAVSRDPTVATFGLFILAIAILLIFTAFAQVSSFFIATLDAADEPNSTGATFRFASDRVLPLMGWSVVSSIMMVIGFVLLVIPGIYLSIVFVATLIGVVTVERGNIDRCFRLVNQRIWPTTGRMLLVFLIFITYFGLDAGIEYYTGADSIVKNVLSWIFSIIIGLFGVGVSVVTYAELRFHENPTVLTPTLVSELRRA